MTTQEEVLKGLAGNCREISGALAGLGLGTKQEDAFKVGQIAGLLSRSASLLDTLAGLPGAGREERYTTKLDYAGDPAKVWRVVDRQTGMEEAAYGTYEPARLRCEALNERPSFDLAGAERDELHRILAPVLLEAEWSPAHEPAQDAVERVLKAARLNAEAGGGDGAGLAWWKDRAERERARAEQAEKRAASCLAQAEQAEARAERLERNRNDVERRLEEQAGYVDRLRASLERAERERDEARALIPLACCSGANLNCYGPRGCLVRAQEANVTPGDVLLKRAEDAECECARLRAELGRVRGAAVQFLRENDVRPGGLGCIAYTQSRDYHGALGSLYCALAGIDRLPEELYQPAFYAATDPAARPAEDASDAEGVMPLCSICKARHPLCVPCPDGPAPYAEERDTFDSEAPASENCPLCRTTHALGSRCPADPPRTLREDRRSEAWTAMVKALEMADENFDLPDANYSQLERAALVSLRGALSLARSVMDGRDE